MAVANYHLCSRKKQWKSEAQCECGRASSAAFKATVISHSLKTKGSKSCVGLTSMSSPSAENVDCPALTSLLYWGQVPDSQAHNLRGSSFLKFVF